MCAPARVLDEPMRHVEAVEPHAPAPASASPSSSGTAVLIGSVLRAFTHFARARLRHLFEDGRDYSVFISTDNASLACLHDWRRDSGGDGTLVWAAESPDPAVQLGKVLGPLVGGPWSHLIQWHRLLHAWRALERYEGQRRGGVQFAMVYKLRTDLYLPLPLPVRPEGTATPPNAIWMRGDWLFWGRREAMATCVDFVHVLPEYMRLGDKAYLPVPWRKLLAVGEHGLHAGFYGWLWYPKKSESRSWGFTEAILGNKGSFLRHIQTHLDELEAFELSDRPATLRPPHDLVTQKPQWFPNEFPENEKLFYYHVVLRGLQPRAALKVLPNVSMHGARGLLLPHRKSCLCKCSSGHGNGHS